MDKHEHKFQIDKTRKHKRPGFYFAKCPCGQKAQATVTYGVTHYFQTNKKRGGSCVISFRVNDEEKAVYNTDPQGYKDEFRLRLRSNP